jgi:MFS family permease
MTTPDTSWRAFFSAGGIALLIFVGGITLQAMEGFIGSAMLPTVVHDIGGLDYFAWNTTLFIVASIVATVFAAVRPERIGPRDVYVLAAIAFGLGSLICGLAPNIAVLLVGRTVQGFGAGLIIATTLAMIRIVFPQHLWPRAMALNSMVWGIATLLGPAVGGVFANYGLWRWAFLSIVPLAALLAIGAIVVLPRREETGVRNPLPLLQIGLVIAAILLISIASLITNDPILATVLLGLAVATVATLSAVERRSPSRLLPEGALSPGHPLATLFITIMLLGMSITSDIFAPLFLQRLHGLSPLAAGYLTALVALGWTVTSIVSSGFTGRRVHLAILATPVLMTLATIGLGLALAVPNEASRPLPIILCGLFLFILGSIGFAFQHLSTGVLASGSAADNDRVSATLGMVQLFASGLGAAIGGVAVNAAGLPRATSAADLSHAASVLLWVFTVITALAVPFAWRVVQTAPHLRPTPAE